MKYSIALTAASLASGAVAGVVHGHAGAHQHRAREANAAAEAEPEATNYTYSDGQCWGAYGCDAKTGAPAAQTSAPAATTAAAPAAQVTAAAAPVKNVVSQATSAVASAASAVKSSTSSSSGGSVNVASLLSGIKGDSKILAAVAGNLASEGTTLNNVFEITNNAGEDLVYVCWGSASSWVNKFAPILAVGIPEGQTKSVSFADTPAGQQGPACAPVTSFATMANGQIKNTWLEHTFNSYGTLDVSREPSIYGNSISLKTPQGCTSDMDTCVYKCTSKTGENGTGQCKDDYQLVGCDGQKGSNPSSDGKNGGCQFGENAKISLNIGPVVNTY